ncbi:MAG: hypothetical protein IJG13_11915, partial [Kiritimatiellae bacterium]|nr:hypothetical protein [Kiritimatiellia bacterium]
MAKNILSCFVAVCASLSAAFVCQGALSVKFGSAMEVEIDGEVQTFAKNSTFTPTAVPCLYKMRPAISPGESTFAVVGDDAAGPRYPTYDDGNWVRVALSGDAQVTLTGYKVSNVYYCDAERGNDTWDGTTDYEHRDEPNKKGPKQSLQAAHDGVASGSADSGYPLVLVAPGVYSNGVTTTYFSGTDYPCNRRLQMRKSMGFVATGGASRTFIVGAPDGSGANGCGPGAVGGVHMTSGAYAFLQGFTITGCYAPASQEKGTQYGTAFFGEAGYSQVLDCVISNNVAPMYPVSYSGTLQRTRIFENRVTSYYLYLYGNFVSCVFARNRFALNGATDIRSSIGQQGSLYFCTVDLTNVDNESGRNRLDRGDGGFYGVLAYGLVDKTTISDAVWHDSLACDNPIFADAAARDYRLGMLSPAIDAASYADGLNDSARRYMTSDVDGRMPVVRDGKVRLGAVWNEPALPVTVVGGDGGGVSVSGGSTGTNIVTSAEQITVTATDAMTRPFVGFEVNGELVATPGHSYSFTPATAAGSVTSVRAVWYVAQSGGNDANDGGAPSRAKATIKAATMLAAPNDVVRVGPGRYGDAEGTQVASSRIGTRVVVPVDVTLESTSGAEKTFIVGASATGDQIDNATYGTGANAVRCVYAKRGSVVRGFTLTGGRGIGVSDSSENALGAAFYSAETRKATMENCIISNNAAWKGTIYRAIVRNCRIFGNMGIADNASGSAAYQCDMYGSIIDRNRGLGVVYDPNAFESCTVGRSNYWMNGDSNPQTLYWYSAADKVIVNCAILGNGRLYFGYGGMLVCTNCVIVESSNNSWGPKIRTEVSSGTVFTNTSGAAVDSATYSPVLGSFVGIDKGNAAAASEAVGDTDIYRTPRILNGALDIGAVEYDWRPAFARELGK